jgi:hypothetical protein
MSARQKYRSASKSEVDSILGPPPILPGEDVSAYETLIARVCADLEPADIIEEIWVRDIVYHTWEILRWRRIKKICVSLKLYNGLPEMFTQLLRSTPEAAAQLTSRWSNGDPILLEVLKQLEKQNGFSIVDAVDVAFFTELDNVERIDRLLSILESRRNAVLREIERRRATLGQSLRRKLQQVEDAESRVIKLKSTPRKNKAKAA